MRTRAGWPAGHTVFGSGIGGGVRAYRRIRGGVLSLVAAGIRGCAACLLVLAGSLASGLQVARSRPAGQHRRRQPRYAAQHTGGAASGRTHQQTARVLP
jgi:hypothetical protein